MCFDKSRIARKVAILPMQGQPFREQLDTDPQVSAVKIYVCFPCWIWMAALEFSRNTMIQTVQKRIQKLLPRYMVPGVILVVDHIPLSAAGKVEKKALRVLFNTQDIESFTVKMDDDTDEAWTEDEQKIRAVFSEISQVPVQGIRQKSTIYEIGLDSISASQVAVKLKKVGVQVSVIDILERPSIELLSALLAEGKREFDEIEALNSYLPDFHSRFAQAVVDEKSV